MTNIIEKYYNFNEINLLKEYVMNNSNFEFENSIDNINKKIQRLKFKKMSIDYDSKNNLANLQNQISTKNNG